MAVIVKYIVVRDGDEKMTFATKKEADAYDKMLDIADNLFDFFEHSDIKLNETRKEEICLLLAKKREEVMPILRGVSVKAESDRKKQTSSSEPVKPRAKPPVKQAASKTTDRSESTKILEPRPVPKSSAKAASSTKAESAIKNDQEDDF